MYKHLCKCTVIKIALHYKNSGFFLEPKIIYCGRVYQFRIFNDEREKNVSDASWRSWTVTELVEKWRAEGTILRTVFLKDNIYKNTPRTQICCREQTVRKFLQSHAILFHMDLKIACIS